MNFQGASQVVPEARHVSGVGYICLPASSRPDPGQSQMVTDALCVLHPFSLILFLILGVFCLGSIGFQGCWLMPRHRHPGPAVLLIEYARD